MNDRGYWGKLSISTGDRGCWIPDESLVDHDTTVLVIHGDRTAEPTIPDQPTSHCSATNRPSPTNLCKLSSWKMKSFTSDSQACGPCYHLKTRQWHEITTGFFWDLVWFQEWSIFFNICWVEICRNTWNHQRQQLFTAMFLRRRHVAWHGAKIVAMHLPWVTSMPFDRKHHAMHRCASPVVETASFMQ